MAVGQFFWSDDIYSIRSDIMIHRYSEQWSSVNTSLESDPCGWSIPRYYDNSNRALWRSRQPLRARTKPRRSWIDTPSLQQQEVYLQSLRAEYHHDRLPSARILHPVNCELSDTRFMPRLDLDTFDTRDTINTRIKDFILFWLCPLASPRCGHEGR